MAANSVDQYFLSVPASQQFIMNELRYLIKQTAPELQESLKWGVPWYAYKKNICYLAPHDGYLNFGFAEATLLPDPEKLLEGTGAKMRHVKIYPDAEIPTEALRQLIREAIKLQQ